MPGGLQSRKNEREPPRTPRAPRNKNRKLWCFIVSADLFLGALGVLGGSKKVHPD